MHGGLLQACTVVAVHGKAHKHICMVMHAPMLHAVGPQACAHSWVPHVHADQRLVTRRTSQILENDLMYSACFPTNSDERGPRSAGVTASTASRCPTPSIQQLWSRCSCDLSFNMCTLRPLIPLPGSFTECRLIPRCFRTVLPVAYCHANAEAVSLCYTIAVALADPN